MGAEAATRILPVNTLGRTAGVAGMVAERSLASAVVKGRLKAPSLGNRWMHGIAAVAASSALVSTSPALAEPRAAAEFDPDTGGDAKATAVDDRGSPGNDDDDDDDDYDDYDDELDADLS